MVGKKEYAQINMLLNELLEKKQILIAVHRGSAAGNIIENTIPAYSAALQLGGDIIESDVIISRDKVVYNFHSGMEYKNFQEEIDIQTLTSSEIEKLVYFNSNSEKTNYPVQKLNETLEFLNGKCLVNIDRAWNFFPEVCEIIEKENMVKQTILKGPLTPDIVKYFQNHKTKFMFMPKIEKISDLKNILDIENINIVGVEVKVETEESDFFSSKNIKKIKDNNLFVWINALTIDDNKKLFAGYDDNRSIFENNIGWKVLMEKGADIIQTDWPSLLNDYKINWLKRNK